MVRERAGIGLRDGHMRAVRLEPAGEEPLQRRHLAAAGSDRVVPDQRLQQGDELALALSDVLADCLLSIVDHSGRVRSAAMTAIEIRFISGHDVERLAIGPDAILAAVEDALRAQGTGQVVLEPREHLVPDPAFDGHFNVLRAYVAPLGVAGVKVVGDYVGNWKLGLPSELALLTLYDPRTGVPRAIVDATAITEWRTGAVIAIGSRQLARPGARVLGHVGARGTAFANVCLLDRVLDLEEIRVTSAPAALVIPYGTMSAVELSLTSIMDKVFVDDWGQCRRGPFGALRAHVEQGLVTEDTIAGALADVVAGTRPGRERDDERILFWHRGLATTDVALGQAILDRAVEQGVGTLLPYR